MKKILLTGLILSLLGLPACATDRQAEGDAPADIVAAGTVTLVDLGATTCVPCQMMFPVLDELKKEYAGRVKVIFVDVHKKSDKARRFKVSMIPTQVIYDQHRREVFRHVGFIPKDLLVKQLQPLL